MEANSKAAKIPPSLLVKALPAIRQKIEAFFIWDCYKTNLQNFKTQNLTFLNFPMICACLVSELLEDAVCKIVVVSSDVHTTNIVARYISH